MLEPCPVSATGHRHSPHDPTSAQASGDFAGARATSAVPGPRLTETMLDEAERWYKAGEILRLIASDLGVSRQRFAKRLRERGVRLRGEQPSPEQVLEMCRRYEQGESLARVGAKVGFNASTVRMNLLRAGVALRDPHGRER